MQGRLRTRKFKNSVLQKVPSAQQFEHLGASQQPEQAEEQSQGNLQLAIPEPLAAPDFQHLEREVKRRRKEEAARKQNKAETPGPNKYHVKLAAK